MEKVSRRKFVATAAVAGTAAVLCPPAFAFENQGPGAGTAVAGPVDHEVIAPQASSFPMKNVKLQPGAFSAAADANRKYLKTLPPDRLLHTFRLTAGLPSSAEPLGEWESPIANCGVTSLADITFGVEPERGPQCLAVESGGNAVQRCRLTSRSFQNGYLDGIDRGPPAILKYDVAGA